MAQKALGRLINYVHLAKGVYIDLKDCENVSFLCYLAGAVGDTYTLTESKDAAGTGAKVLAIITKYYTSNGVGGVWTEQNQAAASTVVTTANTLQNAMCVEVNPNSLDDGYSFVKLASTGAGLTTAVVTDLNVQRRPSLLTSLIA